MTSAPSLLFVTGTRADFGLWLPVLATAREQGARVRLLVMAMHLDPRYGHTVDEIEASGHEVAGRVACTAEGDSRAEMAGSLARALEGATPVLASVAPDRLVVLGDRGEQLAAALAAMHLGVRVAHLHGGERTLGAVDDTIRDLISRIADLHLVATAGARDRLLALGVDPGTVAVTGAPGLDAIVARDHSGDAEVRARYGVGAGDYLLVLQHPETVGEADPEEQMAATLDAVLDSGLPAVAVLSNADAGGRAMTATLAARAERLVGVHASIPRDAFLALLAGAAAIVGNSSSGLIEAPLLRTPAVNVGRRQEGRERGDNVIDVPAHRDAIAAAIRRAIRPDFRAGLSGASPYGDGRAAPRIVARLLGEGTDR